LFFATLFAFGDAFVFLRSKKTKQGVFATLLRKPKAIKSLRCMLASLLSAGVASQEKQSFALLRKR
jgi:hypothetical protein